MIRTPTDDRVQQIQVTKQCWRRDILLNALCVTCVAMSPSTHADDKAIVDSSTDTIDTLLETWAARQARIASADVSWIVERAPRGHVSSYQAEYGFTGADTELEPHRHRFRLDGDHYRLDTARWHLAPQMEFGGFERDDSFQRLVECLAADCDNCEIDSLSPYQVTLISKGATRTELLHDAGRGLTVARVANLESQAPASNEFAYFHDLLHQPLLWAYRPLSRNSKRVVASDLQLVEQDSKIGDHACLIIDEQLGSDRTCRFWVDPQQDYCVRRAIVTEGQYPREQYDIEYVEDAQDDWLPKRWSIMVFRFDESFPGQQHTFQFTAASVTEQTINLRIESETFDLVFPVGTIVLDESVQSVSVVEMGGQTRPANAEELNSFAKPRAKIIRCDATSPDAWRWIIGSLVVGAAGLFIYLRRRNLKPLTSSL